MNRNKCSIFAAGTYYSYEKPVDNSLIIGADGGSDYLISHGFLPDFVIGDFDSGTCPENIPSFRLNPVKDETDTFEAVKLGINKGCDEFHIFGASGGRTAHTMANIQTLAMLAEKGMTGFIYGNNEVFTVIHNGFIKFNEKSKGYISVFSLEKKCRGVCEKGLRYSLENFNLSNIYPIGVSNEFIGEQAEISVANGGLLIIYTFDAEIYTVKNKYSGEE
ncbi:MAG: thiamine diphosphokinase [Clostridia bacterium]|nr:thiamine diphosphokinase [Clostridia bacterium]